jgi:hypothetical protein
LPRRAARAVRNIKIPRSRSSAPGPQRKRPANPFELAGLVKTPSLALGCQTGLRASSSILVSGTRTFSLSGKPHHLRLDVQLKLPSTHAFTIGCRKKSVLRFRKKNAASQQFFPRTPQAAQLI